MTNLRTIGLSSLAFLFNSNMLLSIRNKHKNIILQRQQKLTPKKLHLERTSTIPGTSVKTVAESEMCYILRELRKGKHNEARINTKSTIVHNYSGLSCTINSQSNETRADCRHVIRRHIIRTIYVLTLNFP